MKIFNGTDSTLDIPFNGGKGGRISILPNTPSVIMMLSKDEVCSLITTLSDEEIAFIIEGQHELSMFASIPAATSYVCQSLDEAVDKFTDLKKRKKEEALAKEAAKKKADAKKKAESEESGVVPGSVTAES